MSILENLGITVLAKMIGTQRAFAATAAAQVYQGFNYGSTNNDGSCRGYDDFRGFFERAKGLPGTDGRFTAARLYTSIQCGTAADPISAFQAAIDTDTHILAGLWASAGRDVYENELNAIIAAANRLGTAFTDRIIGISVGSEDLYRSSPDGQANNAGVGATGAEIEGYIGWMRDWLRGTPLEGKPIGHVDTWTAWVRPENAGVISAVDFLGHNSFPYFETTKPNAIEQAADNFWSAVQQTEGVAGGKPVFITETGWPSAQPWYNYVALSYVWGQKGHDPSKGLCDLPATIRDATEVTKRLGQRYLWVDRYCIDQSLSDEKQAEIKQMGRIYNGAALTIIAAAGSDPDYGLPGVSNARGTITPRRLNSNWTMAGVAEDPRQLIKRSTWITRAWTYQEVLLSRRRLYFTDSGVYFECRKYNHEESRVDAKGEDLCSNLFNLNPVQDDPMEILECVSEYSKREIGFECDRLNGILGIFGYLAENEDPVFHLFGVPMLSSPVPIQGRGIFCKTHTDFLMAGMAWKVKEGKRRQNTNFPSWSWIGWSGVIEWPSKEIILPLRSTIEVWVECYERLFPLEELCKQPKLITEISSVGQVIHVLANTFEVTLTNLRETHIDSFIHGTYEDHCLVIGRFVTWKSRDGKDRIAQAELFEDINEEDLAQEATLEDKRFKALLLGMDENQGGVGSWVCKLLRKCVGGYEVVGQILFQHICSDCKSESDAPFLPHMVREIVRLV
ncbi:hypothetical protein Daesc_004195 [Daldinia eschscholtzii]|uniref:Heterokaryon incompatibility domain-containing protein n=1 Tax=Daldinia eschscholtzii TaxID=292717 RepID=A0AAX6MNM7_9PEZI